MKNRITRLLLTASIICCTALPGVAADGSGAGPAPRVEELQEKMLNDEGIMALIKALQDEPEMQALLSDPKVLEAVQGGDIGALLTNPRFQRLLDNPRVKEIEKRIEKQGNGDGA